MAFAPVLAVPEDPDKAAVARALADQPFAATTALPPVPPPGGELTPDQLMAAATAAPTTPLPAATPVDQELAAALPVQGGPALSVLPPVEPAPGTPGGPPLQPPKTPGEAAEHNLQEQGDVNRERVGIAEERAKLGETEATERAAHLEATQKATQAILDRQELHRQAAATRVADARAKAESEPYHTYWESRTVGQNVLTGIGLILGGISWNPNHVNRGVQMLEHAMDQDFAMQKEKHKDLWQAVESAEKGEAALDGRQLHELAQFSAVNGAKWDAVAGRLNAAAAANKGRGDVATIKQQALEADRKAIEFWKGAESAEATANHMAEQEKIERERIAAGERNAALRKRKGGGGGVGGGGALGEASIKLKDEIVKLQKQGLRGAELSVAVDRAATALKIPLAGKPNSVNARSIMADLAKTGELEAKGAARELKLSEADEARVVRDTKGNPLGLAPKASDVKKLGSDLAAQEKYMKLIKELADDVQQNGRIFDSADHPQTEKGKHRMSIFAEVQALGRVLAQLQATDAGTKLEHQMIGNAGVGLNPLVSILSPKVLRELGTKNAEQVQGRLRSQLTPMPARMGGDEMLAAARRVTSGESPASDAAKKKAQDYIDAHGGK